MSISGSAEDEHDVITLQYAEEGLLTVDENQDGRAAAFGDDIAIGFLATEFKREVFVIFAGKQNLVKKRKKNTIDFTVQGSPRRPASDPFWRQTRPVPRQIPSFSPHSPVPFSQIHQASSRPLTRGAAAAAMPTQQIPAAPVVGGVTSRRHAKLLHHLFEGSNGGASANAPVKDLRIRRVVPPASAPPPDASPDPATAKPVPAVVEIQVVQSTPPEPSAAAAAEDRDRKPVLPRSKLVRDPASFGYRRLLPFLNQMAAKNGSDISDTPSEPKVSVSANKELGGSDSGLADEAVDGSGSQGGAAPVVDSVEPLAVEGAGDREMQACCDSVNAEPKAASADLASSKPCVAHCTRSRFVHHPSSFSYKRMLPFLRENEISSQEEDRAKIRRVSEEEHIASEGSPEELDVDRVVEEVTSSADGNCAAQIQCAVPQVSLDGSSAAEVSLEVTEEVLASVGDLVADRNAVLANGQRQLTVSEDSPEERDVAEAETTVEEKEASKSDDKSVKMDSLEPLAVKAGGDQEMKELCDSVKEQTKVVTGDLASSKPCLARCTRSRFVPHPSSFSYKRMLPFLMENDISSQEGNRARLQRVPEEKQLASEASDDVLASTAEAQKATPEVVSSSDRQCQLAVLEDFPEESNAAEAEGMAVEENTTRSDGDEASGLTSDKDDSKLLQDKAELAKVQQCQSSESRCPDIGLGSPTKALTEDDGADQHGAQERHDSVASPDGLLLDVGMICKPSHTGVSCSKKQVLSPKKLSPKKGILKRHTSWGCKGICMCLDCSVFRLRADRAFEFSRKQMQEADDVIGNLLEEVASLRSLAEKPSGQQEQIKEACQRASRVEEVARDRRRQMLAELNSHCKIPGPRVKFAQYVNEKMGSVPHGGSNCRRQPPL
ncbi:hypothetical protein ACQ4PT_015046 [Festuca glaucescens]